MRNKDLQNIHPIPTSRLEVFIGWDVFCCSFFVCSLCLSLPFPLLSSGSTLPSYRLYESGPTRHHPCRQCLCQLDSVCACVQACVELPSAAIEATTSVRATPQQLWFLWRQSRTDTRGREKRGRRRRGEREILLMLGPIWDPQFFLVKCRSQLLKEVNVALKSTSKNLKDVNLYLMARRTFFKEVGHEIGRDPRSYQLR